MSWQVLKLDPETDEWKNDLDKILPLRCEYAEWGIDRLDEMRHAVQWELEYGSIYWYVKNQADRCLWFCFGVENKGNDSYFEVKGVFVDKESREKGIAEALLKTQIDHARALKNCLWLSTKIDPDNIGSLVLCNKLGFIEDVERRTKFTLNF